MYPDYPPDLEAERLKHIISEVKDWSIAHGLAVRPPPSYIPTEIDPSQVLATTAPVTIFPSLFPRVCFEQARNVASSYNELYSSIASDEEWLKSIVEELAEVDDFIAKLWNVHLEVKKEGYVQLGHFRSDYMVHIDPERSHPTIKQVEFNTIASSFGGLATKVSGLHKHLLANDAYPDSLTSIINRTALPDSVSMQCLSYIMAKAHQAYGDSESGLRTCIILLVQDPERNVFDQRLIEYDLNVRHAARTFRLPFDRILTDTKVNANHKLIYTPPWSARQSYEVSLVYFRAGYAPTEYETQSAWDARLHIERSAAIKCPSVLTQLAGTKKVQQVLATPHSPHLRRFLRDEQQANEVLETFARIYPMDKSEAGLEARSLATNPETAVRYVLKPQREGGGNNIYRKAIPDFLKSLPETQWPAYILMEMIEPPPQANLIFRNGELQKGGVICELGVYGACLWKRTSENGRMLLHDFDAGYLLRTKGDSSEEGGVATGFGSVDSCCLIDV